MLPQPAQRGRLAKLNTLRSLHGAASMSMPSVAGLSGRSTPSTPSTPPLATVGAPAAPLPTAPTATLRQLRARPLLAKQPIPAAPLAPVDPGPAAEEEQAPLPLSAKVLQSETLLGTGAFGSVYLGVHEDSGEMIAIKKVVIGDASAEARKQVELLVQEIRLMKQLDHPNVVRYLHAERQGTTLCIYMEFMAGGTLTSMLKKFSVLSPSVARAYMRHALHGVVYLHQRNIVHRDIKPDNILLNSKGVAKLSDFGTSREFSDSANLLTVTGTPWFMAPEVVKGSGHGAPADMWSIGCTLIQLLTGRVPFEHLANPVTAMFNIATNPAKVFDAIPDSLPADAQDAIRLCLHEDPQQRITAAQLLAHPFFAGDAHPGTTPPVAEPAARPSLNMRSVVRAPRQGRGERAAPDRGLAKAPPVIGTPRSFAAKLREQTQHEQ